ncbi:hypothetical protein [Bradyrhizobium sp. USDA 3458]|uniref:hypothetical protein n=1 Tax=Bradyrhizobium sp. USDA 3458 TaxID=2591461 RepID=UPI001143656A|nr:hypothetical protein [Bradyrhizobium sp. USDA 3458]
MHVDPKRINAPPAAQDRREPAKRIQSLERNRRVVRTVDLTVEDMAAIEASEMAPGFEHLDTEVDEA